MNRRRFLGQVVLGTAALASLRPRVAAQSGGGLTVHFVGLMLYVTRSDGSLMVALPGGHPLGHYSHVPFLMAPQNSAIADALGMKPHPGVVPGAFDARLATASANAFAFRCLEGLDVEIVAQGGGAVDHRATHLAQMTHITKGKRLRSDLRRWSVGTISVRGGQLDNAAAHPDAGKVWTFGDVTQPLTDATMYRAGAATVRLYSGAHVDAFAADAKKLNELWVVCAAGPRSDAPDPKRLEHASLLFEFFSNATAVVPTCAAAEGRITLATEYPCGAPTLASLTAGAAPSAPPFSELCPGGGGCCD